ncbi:MAG: hypothetical protein GY898_04225 [Proteobacteria bacterium]|nr:hypothetical protein [Pseudomonadota bacterium]
MSRAAIVVMLALMASGCQTWEAQGGTADLTLSGDLPWTTAPQITTSIEVDGPNQAEASVLCSVKADGSYSIAAYTAELEELKRVRAVVRIPNFAGTSSYGSDEDPSPAYAELTLREGGENSWASDGAEFPCTGWVDLENIEGEFTCTGITGKTPAAEEPDGPIDFDLSYLCGPGTN